MKIIVRFAALVIATAGALHAQFVSINATGASVYTQNFDGLPITGNATGANGTTAFSSTNGTQTHIGGLGGVTGMSGWYGAKRSGNGGNGTNLIADSGLIGSGGIYSYGGNGSTDRALGMLASGTNTMTFGVVFQNDTVATLDEITLTMTGEFWRSSNSTQNVLTFGYGKVDGTTVTLSNFLTANATAFSALNVVGPPAVVGPNGPLDGSLPANQQAFSLVSITGIALAPGEQVFLRWQDTNDVGNDAGLAIDDLVVGAAIPEPGAWVLIGFGSAFMIWNMRRRRG